MSRVLGAAANALGVACVVVALVRYETADSVVFGALDRGPDVIERPALAPWLVAAVVLACAGTLLLLRGRRG